MSKAEDNRTITDRKIQETDSSVYAYDRAIVEDLRARFKKTNGKQKVNDTVQIGPPDKAFEIIGTLNDDKVTLPFISLERENWNLNLDRQGYQTFVGEKIFKRIAPDNKPVQVRAQVIPITIHYRLSIYTKDRATNDALCRELLFYYHLRPSLLVYVPHGLNIAHKFNIYFNSDIEDNSDIANHDNNGTFFRQDMTLYTDDAYLWHGNYQPLVEIEPNLSFSYDSSDFTGDI